MTTNQKIDKIETFIDLDSIDDQALDLSDIDISVETKTPYKQPLLDDGEPDPEFNAGDFNVTGDNIVLDGEDDNDNKTKTKKVTTQDEEEEDEDDTSKTSKKKNSSQERIRQLVHEKKTAEAEKKRSDAVAVALALRLQEAEAARQEQNTRSVDSEASLWQAEVAKAQGEYTKALETGEASKVAEAQVALNNAQFKANLASARKTSGNTQPKPEDFVKEVLHRTYQENPVDYTQVEKPDESPAHDWVRSNMTILGREDIRKQAESIYLNLQNMEGYDKDAPETFEEVEERLQILYPELERWFSKKTSATKKKQETKVEEHTTKKRQDRAPPSAQGSRTTGGQNYQVRGDKVVVKPTDLDKQTAQNLGIGLKDYMVEKIKFEASQARGSRTTSIFND